jgi:hypothetical protein
LPPGNPFVQQTIIQSIEQALAAKGLTKVEENPEITIIAFYAAANADIQIGYPNWSHAMGSSLSTELELIRKPGWSQRECLCRHCRCRDEEHGLGGSATQALEHGPTGNPMKDAKTVEKPIKKAVEKMFKQYPSSQLRSQCWRVLLSPATHRDRLRSTIARTISGGRTACHLALSDSSTVCGFIARRDHRNRFDDWPVSDEAADPSTLSLS